MKKVTYKITDAQGIHARPAGLLVKTAGKFQSNIILTGKSKDADAKKILAVMSLGIKQGDSITLTIDGADEAEAAKAIEQFLNENL